MHFILYRSQVLEFEVNQQYAGREPLGKMRLVSEGVKLFLKKFYKDIFMGFASALSSLHQQLLCLSLFLSLVHCKHQVFGQK